MTAYPQLANGAIGQYPVRKRRQQRTVVNRAADGSAIRLADPAGETTEWILEYSELSDDEVALLERFFTAAEGALNGFTFLDPTANLLEWSEELTDAAWERGPFLGAAPGSGYWTLSNSGAGPQSISQTISAPGDYLYCFSVYARARQSVEVTTTVATQRSGRVVSGDWTRLVLAAKGEAGSESVTFGLEIPGGASVDIRGIQAEAQPSASVYKVSSQGGVYENARFSDDALTVVTTGPNRNSCTVKITHVNHL